MHAACSSPHRCDAKCIHNSAEAHMLRVRAHAARAKRMGMCKARASAGGMWGAHLRAREPRGSGLLEVVFMLASTLPRTSGCSETIESERNPPETGWDGFGCFPAVVRWSQTVTSTCGGPAVGRARGLPKFYNKCCRFYNKLQQSVTTAGRHGGTQAPRSPPAPSLGRSLLLSRW